MPRIIDVEFRPRNKPRHYKPFQVFKYPDDKNHKDFPKFFIHQEVLHNQDVLNRVGVNTYVETYDNWIVPIVYASKFAIRIPNGGQYDKRFILEGGRILFDACGVFKIKGTGNNRKIKQEKAFCWAMAQQWNTERALRIAGYNMAGGAKAMGAALLRVPEVREGIMSAIKEHLRALQKPEEEFVLVRKQKLMDNLESVEKTMRETLESVIKSGKKVDSDLATKYLQVTQKLSDQITEGAEWLNYEDKLQPSTEVNSSNFNFITGLSSNNNNSLPENIGNVGMLPKTTNVHEIKSIKTNNQNNSGFSNLLEKIKNNDTEKTKS